MGDVKVKVRMSNLIVGSVVDGTTQYKKNQEFVCSEEEAKRLGNSVFIVEKIPEEKQIVKK